MSKTAKTVIIASLGIALFLFSWFALHHERSRATAVGVIAPLTGDAAPYGQSCKKGIDLRVDLIKQENAETRLSVIYEDSQASPGTAVSAFTKLTTVDHAMVVISGGTSSEALALAPLSRQYKLPVVASLATAPQLTGASPYFFRNVTSDTFEGNIMARFAYEKLGVRTVAVAYVNNDYGQGLFRTFANEFQDLGGKITEAEALQLGGTDFRASATKIVATKPEAVYVVGYKEVARFLQQATELGLRARILSGSLFEDPEILQRAGQAVDGAYFTSQSFDPKAANPAVQSFVKHFREKYATDPDLYSALCYDAMGIVAQALRDRPQTGDEVAKNLAATRDFPGVTGTTTFDKSGDARKNIAVKKVEGGKFVFVQN